MDSSDRFYSYIYISYDTVWDKLCILGRTPRTNETLPDFCE